MAEAFRRDINLMDPIVYTLDFVIISGHTRWLACKRAGIQKVPARQYPIRSVDSRFPELLVAFNNQRVKTADELFREALVTINPDEAVNELHQFRHERVKVATARAKVMEFGMARRRWGISDPKRPFLNAIVAALEELRDFWPVSNRQIHYRLLNRVVLRHSRKPESKYVNNLQSYKDLNDVLTRARLSGLIPFHAISDETRPHSSWTCYSNPKSFIDEHVENLLTGYNRDLLVSQPYYIELVVEKLTVVNVVERIAIDYCVPMTVGRGYASLDARYKLAERFRKSGKDRLALVIVSDFDPEGEDLAALLPRSLTDEFNVKDVFPVKAALTSKQVTDLRLPPKLTAKSTSSRRNAFVAQHGENIFELEAVEPRRLQQLVRNGIESVLDIELFKREQENERRDAAELAAIRRQIQTGIAGVQFSKSSTDDDEHDDRKTVFPARFENFSPKGVE